MAAGRVTPLSSACRRPEDHHLSTSRPHREVDVPALVEQARAGRPRAVARLISLVEDAHPALPEITAALVPLAGRAHVVGITGSPGVGKSTSTNALIRELRSRGRRVGVLAVDPSSPFTGGALLGDRIRMSDHALDPDVFIRSMASRGHLGGVSWATPQAIRVLDAAGFDVVIVETVGVGQSEVEIAGLADTSVVLLAPGMGDGIQAAKAGILEIGDLFVVNKADRDGADSTVRDLRHMISLQERQAHDERAGGEHGSGGSDEQPHETAASRRWRPRVLKTVASAGTGVADVAVSLDEHLAWLTGSGTLAQRRTRRAAHEIETIALHGVRRRLAALTGGGSVAALATEVVAGSTDPYAAAEALLTRLVGPASPPADPVTDPS